jgi:hypothetical protein
MRIIKLSSKDISFPTRASVATYFEVELPNSSPVGQFLFTKGRIRKDGIDDGEPIIFSYQSQIAYIAKASSGRVANLGGERQTYPFYFLVDTSTIAPAQGNLADVETKLGGLGIHKNIVRTRGWPQIPDSDEVNRIWNGLKSPNKALNQTRNRAGVL